MLAHGPVSGTTVDCLPLPRTGPGAWWHEELGIDLAKPNRGQGIRIGVIDTGYGPHPALAHVTPVGAYIEGQHIPGGTDDVRAHGTHCTGIIGARPAIAMAGGAQPASRASRQRAPSTLHGSSHRREEEVQTKPISQTPSRNCRANATATLLISASARPSLPKSSTTPSLTRWNAGHFASARLGMRTALSSTLQPFAKQSRSRRSANRGGGRLGHSAAARLPVENDRIGERGLYLANFSCFGEGLSCAAPGVGILSTFPDRNGQTNL